LILLYRTFLYFTSFY